MRPEVQGRSGRSLGVAFRSQLLLVYEPSDVPTLPGLYSLDVLQASLNTPLLQRAALQAIDDVKLFSLHLPGVLGKVEPTEADSLLGLWQRAAEVRAAEARRPQRGRPRHRIEYALRQNMTGNRYSAALRKAVYLYRHKSGTERSISMRGAASLARDGATLLFHISDDDIARVRLPSAGTCSLIDRAVHRVQRMQEVEFTFSRVTYFVAFDLSSRSRRGFIAGHLGATRPHDGLREVSCFASHLGKQKTAAVIARETLRSVKATGAPLELLHFICSDNDNTMSGRHAGVHKQLCELIEADTGGGHC